MNELLLDELLSVGEAAHKLRVSKATIAAWLCRGKLRRVKAGSRTLVRASDLAAALDLDGKSPAPLRKPTPAPDAA